MTFPVEDVQRLRRLLEGAGRVLLICHSNPDGDALGSLLGAAAVLRDRFPNKEIVCACRDPAPSSFHFLPGASAVRQRFTTDGVDLTFILDAAEPKLTGLSEEHPRLFDGSLPTVNVDHHPTNTRFGLLNFIVPDASSTAEILVHLFSELQIPIGADAATCLLTGIFTDTGSLLHSNTTAGVCRTLALLLRNGAGHQRMVREVFRTSSLPTLKLWGRVLEKIAITEEQGAVSAVTAEDFSATGADFSDLTGAIDYLNAVPGMRFSLILSEREGVVKGSLRTLRDDVDVATMAQKLSGGGHRKAAGFSVPGKLTSEVRWKIVPEGGE